MAQVITLPNQRPQIIENFLNNYMRSRQMDQESAANAERNKILQQNADAQSKQAEIVRLKSLADAAKNQYDALVKAGAINQANQFLTTLPPEWRDYVGQQRPATSYDETAANFGTVAKGATGRIAAGGNDVQDRNLTTLVGTQQQLSKEAFSDAQQRNLAALQGTSGGFTMTPTGQKAPQTKYNVPSNDAYQNALRRDQGDLTTAGQTLQSQTQKDVTGMQIAADRPVREAQARMYSAEANKAEAEATIAQARQKILSGQGGSNAFAQGVILSPQSYYGLTTDEKQLAAAGLGGRVPKRLTDYETRRMDAAENGMTILQAVKDTAEKWQKRGIPITGPAIGRYNQAQAKWGDQLLPSNLPPQMKDEYLSDIAAIQENLTANVLQEAASIIGSRPAYQVIEQLYLSGPSINKAGAMFRGSVNNMLTRYQTAYDQINRKQWGGEPPTLVRVGGQSAPTPAQPAPAPAGKTVTRAELKAMGSTEAEARANGYTVVP